LTSKGYERILGDVSEWDDWYNSLQDANAEDLTVTYTPIVVILKDGTRLYER